MSSAAVAKKILHKNPKLIISQFYDSLVQLIDIYTEEKLEKHFPEQTIEQFILKDILHNTVNNKRKSISEFKYGDLNLDSSDNIWSILEEELFPLFPYSYDFDFQPNISDLLSSKERVSLKSHGYFNKTRDEMLAELKRAQDEVFDEFESIKSELSVDKTLSDAEQIETLRSQLFSKKFVFFFEFKYMDLMANIDDDKNIIYMVVLDFYLNENSRQLLKSLLESFDVSISIKFKYGNILKSFDEKSENNDSIININVDGLLVYFLAKYIQDLIFNGQLIKQIIRIEKKKLLALTNTKFLRFGFVNYNAKEKIELSINEIPKNVEVLEIYKNRNKLKLNSNIFTNLSHTHIRRLALLSCDFPNTPPDAFEHLTNLEVLVMRSQINCSHIKLADMPRLKWLSLALKNKDHMPILTLDNTDLQVLQLFGNSRKSRLATMETIQNSCSVFRRLKAFYLTGFSDEFDLEWLCEKNDDTFSNKLELLHLRQMKSIKGSFANFVNLRSLDFFYCPDIKIFPGMFNGLKNLKSLNLDDCTITSIEGLFDGLTKLEKLKITKSNGLGIENLNFCSLNNLIELDLSENVLIINKDTFSRLAQLKSLKLKSCLLTKLDDDVLSPLKSLEELDLSYNMFLEIINSTFNGLEKLRVLIYNGVLNEAPKDAFVNLKNLEKIEFNHSVTFPNQVSSNNE